MTVNLIYAVFGLICVYDIIAVIIQNKKSGKKFGVVTITSVFRRWYKGVIVPFMVGGIFLGHFGIYKWNNLLERKTSIIVFLVLSGVFLVWYIIERIRKNKSKFYKVCCDFWPLPMTMGIIAGSFWK
nr:hypothetical protein 1 [Legionellales bacterium]